MTINQEKTEPEQRLMNLEKVIETIMIEITIETMIEITIEIMGTGAMGIEIMIEIMEIEIMKEIIMIETMGIGIMGIGIMVIEIMIEITVIEIMIGIIMIGIIMIKVMEIEITVVEGIGRRIIEIINEMIIREMIKEERVRILEIQNRHMIKIAIVIRKVATVLNQVPIRLIKTKIQAERVWVERTRNNNHHRATNSRVMFHK